MVIFFKNGGIILYIAIDGPAGAGKSTVARELAKILKIKYLDSGAMYRAITLKVLTTKTDLENAGALKNLLDNTKLEIVAEEDKSRVFIDGEEVTEAIRSSEVNGFVSQVSTIPMIRKQLVQLQRDFASEWGSVVMDGRDIGTTVLPDADLKIYLEASPEERVNRRFKEYHSKGRNVSSEEVEKELTLRDTIDSERELSPLEVAPGAIILDTTEMTINEVVKTIADLSGRVKD